VAVYSKGRYGKCDCARAIVLEKNSRAAAYWEARALGERQNGKLGAADAVVDPGEVLAVERFESRGCVNKHCHGQDDGKDAGER